MDSPIRLEVQELIYACEKLARQDAALTVQECEVVFRCAKELEKKVLPDRQQSDWRKSYPTSDR
jgi:hypothetical protein